MNSRRKEATKALLHGVGSVVWPLCRRRAVFPHSVKTIVVALLHYVGDSLFAMPALRALRTAYPDAHLAVWVKSRTAGLFRGSHLCNEVIVFDDVCTDSTRERPGSLRRKRRFARDLRQRHIDLFIDVAGVVDSLLIGLLSGARYRAGVSSQGLGFMFDSETKIIPGEHLVDRYARVIESIGIPVTHRALNLDVSHAAASSLNSRLVPRSAARLPYIVIHPQAGWREKCWPAHRYAELANRLTARAVGEVIIVGTNDDATIAQVSDLLDPDIRSMTDLSLSELAALISKCDLFIGNDSGPAYIAEALRRRLIVFFGPTNPLYSAPRTETSRVLQKQLPCSPRSNQQSCGCRCRRQKCLELITVEEVVQTVQELLQDYGEQDKGHLSHHRA